MENIAIELVSQKIAYFKEEHNNDSSTQQHNTNNGSQNHISRSSLLEEYLKNPNLDLSDIVGTYVFF